VWRRKLSEKVRFLEGYVVEEMNLLVVVPVQADQVKITIVLGVLVSVVDLETLWDRTPSPYYPYDSAHH